MGPSLRLFEAWGRALQQLGPNRVARSLVWRAASRGGGSGGVVMGGSTATEGGYLDEQVCVAARD